MLILTIESSCDETSVAVVREGRELLSNAVASQIPVHQRYGGVVPEIASRNHIRDIQPVLDRALREAGVDLDAIDGFGVTAGPGLVGSLLVGIETAKGLAYANGRPCVGVNHIEGHLTTVLLDLESTETPSFPYVGLVASGGHSHLYVVRDIGDYQLLGRTRDDAAGEAFDKVAKMLGLPYPGGIEIDQRAERGDPEAIDFPRPMIDHDNFDFSFAGLKTAVHQFLDGRDVGEGDEMADVCASFQQAVVDVLVDKTVRAASRHGIPRIVLSGGVAANSVLRSEMRARAAEREVDVFVAPTELCTDNAGMLGPIAHHHLEQVGGDGFDGYRIRAESNVRLEA